MSDYAFPVALDIRIDWSDLDLFGHVNNVAFLKYVQASRVHYWEHIGLYRSFLETRTGPILASTSCQFFKPLFFPGNITVLSRMETIGNTSFGLHHRIMDSHNDIAAEAHDVMVLFDFNTHEKVIIPEWLRSNIGLLEQSVKS